MTETPAQRATSATTASASASLRLSAMMPTSAPPTRATPQPANVSLSRLRTASRDPFLFSDEKGIFLSKLLTKSNFFEKIFWHVFPHAWRSS